VAAFPVDMYLSGAQPSAWYSDIRSKADFLSCLAEESENIQEKINENREIMAKNAQKFRVGALLGIGSPVAGLIVWLLTSSSYWV
jgi:hypothetical protein